MARNILFEVSPLVNGVPTTIRMASAAASSAGTQLDGKEWLPLISTRPTREYTFTNDGILAQIEVDNGSISFRMSSLYENEEWSQWEWVGALGRYWIGEDGQPFETYEKRFEGSVGSISRDGITATVELLGPDATLDVPLLSLPYAGTGDLEGDTSMEGKLKPRTFGLALSIEPVCINQANQIYQVDGYEPVQSIKVYEYAQALDPTRYKADCADYAALNTLDMSPGDWATCLAHGLFRLSAEPSKKLSADVLGANQFLDKIVLDMLAAAGVPAGLVGDMSPLSTVQWSLYQTESIQVGDAVRDAMLQAGCWLIADPNGVWQLGQYFETRDPITLSEDRSTEPFVRSISEKSAAAPIWKVSYGYDKCWSIHSDSDVSPILADLSDELSDQLKQAAEDAALAKAEAQAAAERLEAMESDGILDRSEKARIVRDFETETAAHTELMNTASTFDIDTERNAYDATFQRLKTYLESLTPLYTDLTQDTPIDPVADNTAWKDYWIAKQILTSKMDGVAMVSADWGNVVGTNKPEDGATVGAPPGTYVGGKPAEDVAQDSDDSKNVITNLSDIIARELAKPLSDVASVALVQNTAHLKTTSIINGNLQEAYRTLTQNVTDQGDQISEDILKLQTSVAGNTAAIQQINRTTSTNNTATAEQINDLTARTNKTAADLATEVQARAADKSAQLEVNQQLATSVSTETGDRKAAISDMKSLLSSSLASQVQTIDQLSTTVTNQGKNMTALDQTLRKVISDGDAANAQELSTLQASITLNTNGITDLSDKLGGYDQQFITINSEIQENKQVAADANGSTAQKVTDLQSQVGSYDARISQTESTVANLNGQVESKYALVVQAQGDGTLTVAGMELIATGAYSAVVFDADEFSIYTNNGTHQVFQATDSGIKMTNVAVDTIVANTVVAAHIKADVLSGLWTWFGNDYLISPSTGEVNVMETEVVQISDGVDGKGQLSIAFDLDALQYNDAGIQINVYLDTGGGYGLARTRYAGIGTGHGDTFYRFPVSFTVPIVTSGTVKVKVTCRANRLSEKFSTGGGTCYVRSPEMTLVKWNR